MSGLHQGAASAINFFDQPLKVLGTGLMIPAKVFRHTVVVLCCSFVSLWQVSVKSSYLLYSIISYKISSEFNLETFANEPSLQVVRTLKKSCLQQIASHFKLTVSTTTRKDELFKMVMQFLVDEELVLEESVEDLPSLTVDSSVLELKRLELQDRERE